MPLIRHTVSALPATIGSAEMASTGCSGPFGLVRTKCRRLRRPLGSVLALDHEVRTSDGPCQLRLLARKLEGTQLRGDVHPFGELEPDRPLRIRPVERV